MGHRYQKGARRPDPTVRRDRGRPGKTWKRSPHALPWPELADGTAWTTGLGAVTHALVPGSVGVLQEPVAWEDGEWVATVAWEDGLLAQIPLVNLLLLSTDE